MPEAHELPSLADAPGTKREYETIYILRPGTSNESVADVNTRVRGIIDTMGGKVLKIDNWGKRRLAYEIAKERKGIYLYWQYLSEQAVVSEVERNLRMLDTVIRYMTVKLDTDVQAAERLSEADEDAFERAANTAADEEDLYLRGAEGEEDGEGDGEFGDDDDNDYVAEGVNVDAGGGDEVAAVSGAEAAGEGDAAAQAGEEAAGAEAAVGAEAAAGAEATGAEAAGDAEATDAEEAGDEAGDAEAAGGDSADTDEKDKA